jgi:hypothetical protein
MAAAASATPFILQPGPEGFDAGSHPNGSTSGADTAIAVGSYQAVNNMRFFNKFDLSSLPTEATNVINKPSGYATYTVYQNWGAFMSPHSYIGRIHRLTEDWDEEYVTRFNRTETELWSNEYGTYDPYVWGVATWTLTPEFNKIEFDVTGLVRAWLNGDYPNYGLAIVPQTTNIAPAPPPFAPGSPTNNYGPLYTSDWAVSGQRPSLEIGQIPVPATLPLLAGALIVLAGLRRLARHQI